MPLLKPANHSLNYRIDGDTGKKPWLMFCNSLGTDLHMWDRQADALSGDFRILRYDRRGHGLSTTPPPPFTIADLGNDVIALLDALGIETTHFCGLSIGGLTGQWLALHAGARLDRLVVCATAAKIGTGESWSARIEAVSKEGLQPLAAATAERWFSPAFRAGEPGVVEGVLDSFAATSIPGYIGCCAVLADADLRGELGRIETPLLAVSGADDPVCPPANLEAIATAVGNGQHVSLPGRHIVSIESTQTFIEVVRSFLSRHNQ
jgi:3-oxoadipate enol-lactonase